MKKFFLIYSVLLSMNVFAQNTGDCNIMAVGDTSLTDLSPKKVFNHTEPEFTVDECIQSFKKDVASLRDCSITTDTKIRYATMEITINKNSIETLEPINVTCKK